MPLWPDGGHHNGYLGLACAAWPAASRRWPRHGCAERSHAAGRQYAPGMIPGFPLAVPGIKYNQPLRGGHRLSDRNLWFSDVRQNDPGGSPSKDIGNGPKFRGQAKDEGLRRSKFWPMRSWRPVPPARIYRWPLTSSQQRLVKTGWLLDTAGPLLPVAAGGASNLTRGSSAAFCEELVYV